MQTSPEPSRFGIVAPPPGYRWADTPYLGRGGSGVVLRAVAIADATEVAVKYTLDRAQPYRFLRELQHLARLDHPQIVRTLGGDDAGNPPYFILEYLAGGTLATYLSGRSAQCVPPSLALAIGGQVADALAYLHGRGLVHRDLKPANLMFVAPPLPEGTPGADDPHALPPLKLMDFGLVSTGETAPRFSADRAEVGTALYMAPEQYLHPADVDGRADLYALGVILFELLTGRLPYPGPTPTQLYWQRQNLPLPRPSAFAAGVPPAVDDLVLRLLAPDRAARIPSAERLWRELAAIAAGLGTPLPPRPSFGDAPPLLRSPLRGRRAELAQLTAAWEDAQQGRVRVVVIAGEAGVGKSHLAAAFLEQPAVDAAVVLQARATSGQTRTFGPVVDLLDQAAARLQQRQAEWPADLAPLAALLPQLAIATPARLPDVGLTPQLARTRLFDAAARLLQAAAVRPLLLLVDDLHECDPDSGELLTFLLHRFAQTGRGLLLLATARPPAPTAPDAPPSPVVRLTAAHQGQTLTLAPLDAAATADVVTGMLGHPLPALAEALQTVTAGNPLFVVEALRNLVERQTLVRDRGRWQWAGGDLPLPASLAALERQRLERLAHRPRRLLRLAALMGQTVRLDVLQQAAAVAPATLLDVTDAWVQLGMMQEVAADQLRFSHPLLREVVRREVPARTRRRSHRRIAQALESCFPDRTPYAAALAEHYAAAGDFAAALPYARRAAQLAHHQFAFGRAVALLQMAVTTILPALPALPPAAAVALWTALGEAESARGGHAAAGAAYEQAFALAARDPAAAPSRRAQLAGLRAREAGWHAASHDQAMQWLDRARDLVDPPQDAAARSVAAQVDIYRAPLLYQRGDFAAAEAACRRGLARLSPDDSPAVEAEGLNQLGAALDAQGKAGVAADAYQASLAIWQRLGNRYEQHRVENNLAALLLQLGRWAEAEPRLERVVAFFRSAGDVNRTTTALTNLGLVYLYRGRVGQAVQRQQEAVVLADGLGIPWLAALVRVNLAWSFAAQGHWPAADTCAQQALDLDPGQSSAEVYRVRGAAALALGDCAAALTHASQALAVAQMHQDPCEEGAACRLLGQIALATGHVEPAQAHLAQSYALLQEIGHRLEVARTARALAQCHAARGDARRVLHYGLQAVAIFQALGALGELNAPLLGPRDRAGAEFEVTVPGPVAAAEELCRAALTPLGWELEDSSGPVLTFRSVADDTPPLLLFVNSAAGGQTRVQVL